MVGALGALKSLSVIGVPLKAVEPPLTLASTLAWPLVRAVVPVPADYYDAQ